MRNQGFTTKEYKMSNTKNVTIGTGICTPLTILFVALKLLDKIDWSWWWVLAPLWIPWAIFIVCVLIVAIAAACSATNGPYYR